MHSPKLPLDEQLGLGFEPVLNIMPVQRAPVEVAKVRSASHLVRDRGKIALVQKEIFSSVFARFSIRSGFVILRVFIVFHRREGTWSTNRGDRR
jgi:hypothetical protein